MKKLIMAGSLILSSLLYAQGSQPLTISQEDIKVQNEISDASTQDITPKSVDDFFNEFKDRFGVEYGQTKDGKTFYTGKANVLVNDTDPQFSKALQLAYQKAMLDLQTEFIKDAFGKHSTQRIQNIESDNSTNAKEFEELPKGGTFSQIMDKVTQLAGAKLDKALQDLGINVQGLSEERKKTLLKEEMITKDIIKAFGSMKGLVPVQTVLTQKRGEYQVGVIAVISNKTRQIATDMSLGRKSIITGKGKAIGEYLPKEKQGYLNEYGIRLIYDENGAPIILSYGNWGYIPEANNARKTNRLEEIAKKNAANQADAAIIEFMNINISLSNEQTTGENYEEIIKQSININDNSTQEQEETIANIIDKVSTKVKTNASGKLRGIRTLKTWDYTGENGVEYVGAIRFYSYENLANTNEALNPSNQKATSSANTPKKSANIQRESNVVNSLDDF
ncbi:DUF6844 domain-containing protein [Helicobacter burdigaliensis]|uniref:DUF6844 domain-containing protein n=1 Tax=Helicobacter burdigaliensis TaxID=2315334 RepID=UPI000EF69BC7|nr:hypothetical protein [Helicobacter burdigaliensis]